MKIVEINSDVLRFLDSIEKTPERPKDGIELKELYRQYEAFCLAENEEALVYVIFRRQCKQELWDRRWAETQIKREGKSVNVLYCTVRKINTPTVSSV